MPSIASDRVRAARAMLAGDQGSARFSVSHVTDIEAVEAEWRALQSTPVASPYQGYSWVKGWLEHVARPGGLSPVIGIVRSGDSLEAIVPLVNETRHSITVSRFVGGSHNNVNMPLMAPEFAARATPSMAVDILDRLAADCGGVDVFELTNQPLDWADHKNPFACIRSSKAPDPLYFCALAADFEDFARDRRSAKSLQTLRRKRRKLETALGPVEVSRAATIEVLDRAFAVFMDQRGARFAAQGISNVFGDPGVKAFLEGGLRADLHAERDEMGSLAIHSLSAGDAILATYLTIGSGTHVSVVANSITEQEAGAKHSPGNLLLEQLLKASCETGVETFDLGAGTLPYKEEWCDRLDLYHTHLPITPLGSIYAIAARAGATAKRRIKENDRLWSLVKSMRAGWAAPARRRQSPGS